MEGRLHGLPHSHRYSSLAQVVSADVRFFGPIVDCAGSRARLYSTNIGSHVKLV